MERERVLRPRMEIERVWRPRMESERVCRPRENGDFAGKAGVPCAKTG